LDAQLIGFNQERDTRYPLFKFTYEGEELTLTGGVPAKPDKFKYEAGDTVKIIFDPSNRKSVDIEGSANEAMSPVSTFAKKSHFRGLFFNLLQFVRTNPDQAHIMWENPEGGFDYEQYCIPDESTGCKARIQKAEAGADGAWIFQECQWKRIHIYYT